MSGTLSSEDVNGLTLKLTLPLRNRREFDAAIHTSRGACAVQAAEHSENIRVYLNCIVWLTCFRWLKLVKG